MNEFELIQKFFTQQTCQRDDVLLGSGDDAAIVRPREKSDLAITTDTLIEDIHFPKNTQAFDIGFKSLAVNLSDLAAMGAEPAWVTMALTLPDANEPWLAEFSRGFFELANRYNVQLIGGDLTHGLLSITIQAQGFIPQNQAITRAHAQPGDLIYVTNTLGDASLGLALLEKKINLTTGGDAVLQKLNRPEPRVATGIKLRGIASAAIDISDGLIADLSHILTSSQVGARIDVEKIPLSETLRSAVSFDRAIELACLGDDYEICFTVPKSKINMLSGGKIPLSPPFTKGDVLVKRGVDSADSYTCIGEITESLTLDLRKNNGEAYHLPELGYRHF